MGKLYTIALTEQQLEDLIDALPDKRPSRTAPARIDRQWGLYTDLGLVRSKGPDRGITKVGDSTKVGNDGTSK